MAKKQPPQSKMTKKEMRKFKDGQDQTYLEGVIDRTDGRRTRVGQTKNNPNSRRIRW